MRLNALGTFVAKQLGNLLCVLGGDALFQRAADLVDLAAELRVACIQMLERDGALDQLVLKYIERRLGALFGIGFDQKLLARLFNLGASVLEVETSVDFTVGLIEGVVDLHVVNFGDDIETGICSHDRNLSDSQEKGLGRGDEAG